MGQTTLALLFGCEAPEDVNLYGEAYDSEGEGLLVRARQELGEDPETPYEAEPALIGFYVAVGGGKDGVAALVGFPLEDLEIVYAEALRVARARWWRFAEWAAQQGVSLPAGRVWLTWTEVS